MAKQVKQYYIATVNDLEALAYGITESSLCQLEIEAAPTMEFFINGTRICIGSTGIYDIIVESLNGLFISEITANRLKYNADKQGNLRYCDRILINLVYMED